MHPKGTTPAAGGAHAHVFQGSEHEGAAEAQRYLDRIADAVLGSSTSPPPGDSGFPRGLRGDLDGLSGRHTLPGLARPNPCVAPAAGVRNGKYCAAGGASGMPVKGSADPHYPRKEAVAPHVTPLTCLPDISVRPDTRPYPGLYGELEIAPGGTLTRLRCVGRGGKRSDTASRGKIHGFTQKSRLRLLDMFASINRKRCGCKPLFVALTYHWQEDMDMARPKKHLNAFLKRLFRRWGIRATVWRMEAQGRGVVHFHLLVFTPQFIPWQWMAENWNDIAAPGDAKHLKSWGRVERVRSWRGVMSYVSKYLAKAEADDGLPEGMGRRWGIVNRHLLPMGVITYAHSFERFLQIKAAINGKRNVMGLDARSRSPFQGTRLYQPEKEARKLLRFLDGDEFPPVRVENAPLFPDGVTPSQEWQEHMLPWWEERQEVKRTLQEIAASLNVQEHPRRE